MGKSFVKVLSNLKIARIIDLQTVSKIRVFPLCLETVRCEGEEI